MRRTCKRLSIVALVAGGACLAIGMLIHAPGYVMWVGDDGRHYFRPLHGDDLGPAYAVDDGLAEKARLEAARDRRFALRTATKGIGVGFLILGAALGAVVLVTSTASPPPGPPFSIGGETKPSA